MAMIPMDFNLSEVPTRRNYPQRMFFQVIRIKGYRTCKCCGRKFSPKTKMLTAKTRCESHWGSKNINLCYQCLRNFQLEFRNDH